VPSQIERRPDPETARPAEPAGRRAPDALGFDGPERGKCAGESGGGGVEETQDPAVAEEVYLLQIGWTSAHDDALR